MKLEYQKAHFLQWVFSFFIVVASLCFTRLIHNITLPPQREAAARRQHLHTAYVCEQVYMRVCEMESIRATKGSGGDECKAEN